MGEALCDYNKRVAAWDNATAIPFSSYARIDCDGREIWWTEYGQFSNHGWQIDRIEPTVLGGGDDAGNLRARHWRALSLGGCVTGFLLTGNRPQATH
jgi:hypothetical protein